MNVMIAGSNASAITGTIGASGTLSEEFNISTFNTFGMLSDGASNGTINFLVSSVPLGTTGTLNAYRLLRDNVGAAVALTVPTGSGAFKDTDLHVLAPYQYVRILSSVAQTGCSFTIVMKA